MLALLVSTRSWKRRAYSLVAELLSTIVGVLWGNDHGNRVIDGQDREG